MPGGPSPWPGTERTCPRSPGSWDTTARRSGSTSTATGHPASPGRTRSTYAPFAAYVLQRAADDRHLRGAGLHREITALGYAGSYSAFTRELRGHGITAACSACKPWQAVTPAPGPRTAVLPVRVAPLAGETIASYLARAAAACHLPLRAVTDVLPPWFAIRAAACDDIAKPGLLQPGDARCLAMLTGITETALRHALPALAGHRDDGRPPLRSAAACRRCAARHGQHEPVPVHLPAHQRACDGTAPGSAAPSRSTSPPPRTSPPPAGRRPGSPASTASPGSCSPRPPPTRRRPAGRMPGDALRRSPWPAPPWTPATRTRPKRRPTPRQSKSRRRSSAHRAHSPAGRNNCQNLARTTWRANSSVTTAPTILPLKKAHAGQRSLGCNRT